MNTKHTWLLRVLLPGLCVAAVACGGNGAEVVRVVPTTVPPPSTEPMPTRVSAPRITAPPPPTEPVPTLAPPLPTAVLTPQETPAQPVDTATEPVDVIPSPTEHSPDEEILDDLALELFVSFGGAGGYCGEAPAMPEGLPAATGRVFQSHSGWVCLWGFSPGDSVNVELHDPSGQLISSREFAVGDDQEGGAFIEILLSFAGRPAGSWTILANSAGASLEAPFHVAGPDLPVISVVPAGSDLFAGNGPMEWPQVPYAAGEQLAIFGAGFPPGQSLPLGIYLLRETDTDAIAGLLHGLVVQVDGQGRFEIYQPLEAVALFGEGTYLAIVQLDPSYQPMAFGFDALGAMGGIRIVPPEP